MSQFDDPQGQAFSDEPLPPVTFLPAAIADAIIDSEPRRRIRPLPLVLGALAWGVIASFVVLSFVVRHVAKESPGEVATKDRLNLITMRSQARYLLGAREWAPGNDRELYLQAKAMNTGPVDQRLRFIVLAGELEGPEEALEQLAKLQTLLKDKQQPLTAEQEFQLHTLRLLYTDLARSRNDAPSVTATEREKLHEQLGWFGDLALCPAGRQGAACPDPEARRELLVPARRVVLVAWLIVAGALGLGFVGLLVLAVLGFLIILGKVQFGLASGQSPAGIYAETFALWMILFAVLSIGLNELPLGDWRLMSGGIAMLLSLGVLLWPRLRGISFRQLREDIGWTMGRKPALEPAAGVASYIMTIPLLLIGVLVVMLLTFLQSLMIGGAPGPDDFASPDNASHPIAIYVARGSWGLRLQVFFLASIVAPVVEETMFRGVLYRHLRELLGGWDRVASIMFSTVVSSFVFAIIHPQGVLAVPALMALACGFALAREWRGTLIPCMVAHGINNGAVLMIGIALLGD
jgi:membrane protease YdiL (CAAX protease family)